MADVHEHPRGRERGRRVALRREPEPVLLADRREGAALWSGGDEGEHDGLPSMATALVRQRGSSPPRRVAKFGVIWHHPHLTEADFLLTM